jgi:hypothetical protein
LAVVVVDDDASTGAVAVAELVAVGADVSTEAELDEDSAGAEAAADSRAALMELGLSTDCPVSAITCSFSCHAVSPRGARELSDTNEKDRANDSLEPSAAVLSVASLCPVAR